MDKRSHPGNDHALKNEIGNTFGLLAVIGRAPNKGTCANWLCKCNCGCGTTKTATGTQLRLGRVSSCKSRKLTEQQIYDRTHGLRKCHMCKDMKPAWEFPYLTKHECKSCRGRNTFILQRLYGITEEEYQELLAKQEGACAICGEKPGASSRSGRWKKYLHVDHEHSAEKCTKEMIRGLLCNNCNAGLGYFKDDPDRVRKAIWYLECHVTKNNT